MENIKALRRSLNLTQGELAEIMGVTHGAVAGWEAGTKYPTADKLPRLAKTLGCKIDELYGENEVKEAV